ncbi:oocyte zinc finger protein XlCOF28-like [Zerene cesonia]|uniref:oocyte zinc finger protein XlCOF28-like n=1 Tax=Zerene cesonia TaxID=33412 RepID=UPI0018E5895D|nr:oocyte zinc finger protein XlCOF28-like [Zerene cesonia]
MAMEQYNHSIRDYGTDLISIQKQPSGEEEVTALYECRICKKTFYNTLALHNHTRLQHDDADVSNSETEQKINDSRNGDILETYRDFKFIPLNKLIEDEIVVENGLSKRTFSEDMSYILVKIEGDDVTISAKRSRLDGVLRRTQIRTPKPPVDLRGPFTCTLPSSYRPDLQCHQIFFNCCEYSLHYREKHTKRRKAALRCQVCEKRLDRDFSATTLPTQLNITNNITFPCRLCGQVFLERTRYEEHNRLIHAKMKPHQCSICAKRFTQQGGLQQHMRMHTGIRPFVCSFCTKAFTQKAGLDQHLRTHTKVKPFKCVICSKCFSQSVHLRQHMRTHTNIQPFECPVCGRRFKQSSHLNFHMRSHVGETNGLIVDQYNQTIQQHDPIDFLNLTNTQPSQGVETIFHTRSHVGETNGSAAEQFTQGVEQQDPIEFLNLSNVQRAQDGDTIYQMHSHVGETNDLIVEQFTRAGEQQDPIDFLNFSNVEPVQDGETIYYAADLESLPSSYQNPMALDPQVMFFDDHINK